MHSSATPEPDPLEAHPNARIATDAWNAVANGDPMRLRELLAQDVVWHVTGASPWSGSHLGRDAALQYLADVGETGRAYRTRLDDVMVSDDRAAFVCQVSAKRGERILEVGYVLMLRIEDEQIAEVWTLPMDPARVTAFFAATG